MSQVQQFLSVLTKNVPLSEMSESVLQGWIENPSALRETLRSALIPPQNGLELKVWKTIKIGVGPNNADEFLRHLKDANIKIHNRVSDMMSKPEFTVSAEERELDLVVVSVADLGFVNGACRDKIYAKAKELGLEECPPCSAVQLRLCYRDQKKEWLDIAMEPIIASDGYPYVFSVVHDFEGLWLYSHWHYSDYFWRPDCRWVFVRPRK